MTGATPELLYSTPHGSTRRTKFHVKWITVALIVGSLFFACPEPASAQETYCPESISVEQTVAKIPEGWAGRLGRMKRPAPWRGLRFIADLPRKKPVWCTTSGQSAMAWHTAFGAFNPNLLTRSG
jgi:hypothetical protein